GAGGGEGEVGDRAGGNRNARREPVELADEIGHDQADRRGRTGRGGHDVDRRGTGPAEVLVRAILQVLVGSVGVDSRHQATLDAEVVVEHLGQGGKAVRGARGVRDDVVVRRVVRFVVDAHHEGRVLAARRCRDQHLLGSGIDVLASIRRLGEEAGGLDDDVYPEVAPGQVCRVAVFEDLDRLAVDNDLVTIEFDVGGEPPCHGVVLEEVGERLVVGEVVDRDNLEVTSLGQRGAKIVAADATESVDSDLDAHEYSLVTCARGATLRDRATLTTYDNNSSPEVFSRAEVKRSCTFAQLVMFQNALT